MSFWDTDLGIELAEKEDSAIDVLLKSDECTLEKLLDEDEIIQECAARNKDLIAYLSNEPVVEHLVRLITIPPDELIKGIAANPSMPASPMSYHRRIVEPPRDIDLLGPPPNGQSILEPADKEKGGDEKVDVPFFDEEDSTPSTRDDVLMTESDQKIQEVQTGAPPDDPKSPNVAKPVVESNIEKTVIEFCSPENAKKGNTETEDKDVLLTSSMDIPEEKQSTPPKQSVPETPPINDIPSSLDTSRNVINPLQILQKRSYIASELLALDLNAVTATLLTEPLLSKLFEFLYKDKLEVPVYAAYFQNIACLLCRREPKKIFDFVSSFQGKDGKGTVVDRIVHHIGDRSILDFLVNIGWEEETFDEANVFQGWLVNEDLISKLIDKLLTSTHYKEKTNITTALRDIIDKCPYTPTNTKYLTPLYDQINTQMQLQKIVEVAFRKSDICEVGSFDILITMLHRYPNVANNYADSEVVLAPAVKLSTEKLELCRDIITSEDDKMVTYQWGKLKPLGEKRFKAIEMIMALMRTPHANVIESIMKLDLIPVCVAKFFEYPWHNLLHGVVEHITQMVIAGNIPELQVILIEKTNLLDLILDAWEKDQNEKHFRLGYMGHITRISNTIINHASQGENLEARERLKGYCTKNPRWVEYEQGTLKDANEKLNFQLGGFRPTVMEQPLEEEGGFKPDENEPMIDAENDDDEDDNEFETLFTAKGEDPFSFDPFRDTDIISPEEKIDGDQLPRQDDLENNDLKLSPILDPEKSAEVLKSDSDIIRPENENNSQPLFDDDDNWAQFDE